MKKYLIIVSLVLVGGLSAWIMIARRPVPDPSCHLIALDVGEGDAILFRTPDKQDVLIDGGLDEQVISGLERHLPRGDNDLELVIATHPDGDHLGGLVKVAEKYEIKSVLESGTEVKTKIYQTWSELMTKNTVPRQTAQRGAMIEVGKEMTVQVLWPDRTVKNVTETNDNAVVTKVTCAGSTALLTADVPEQIESRLLADPAVLSAKALKVGHHGSRYSTSPAFLQAVNPEWAVISVGPNKYGHPHPVLLNRLVVQKVPVLRTDQIGDVELLSDGNGGWKRSDGGG